MHGVYQISSRRSFVSLLPFFILGLNSFDLIRYTRIWDSSLVLPVVIVVEAQDQDQLFVLFPHLPIDLMAASTVDDFVLPPGDTFPPQHPGMISMDRPRRKSIDTPVLKLDTSVVMSVTERIDVNDFPPPPKRKADASKVEEKSNQSPAKNKAQKSIKNQNDVQKEDETPVMQSMFPRFDARLSQQSIPLAVERNPPKTTGTHCSPSLYSRPSSPPLAVIARDPRVTSRLSSTFFQQFPQRSEEQPSNIATPAQLSDLWNIAIGKDSPEALPTYNLALKW